MVLDHLDNLIVVVIVFEATGIILELSSIHVIVTAKFHYLVMHGLSFLIIYSLTFNLPIFIIIVFIIINIPQSL